MPWRSLGSLKHQSGVRCMCEDRWWWLGSWQVVMATGSRERYLELEAERTWELWRQMEMDDDFEYLIRCLTEL